MKKARELFFDYEAFCQMHEKALAAQVRYWQSHAAKSEFHKKIKYYRQATEQAETKCFEARKALLEEIA